MSDVTVPPLDPRARRSKNALEAALLELAEFKDLAQISISDITRHAGVSRSTFYEHYADVHDLAASACTELFDELVAGQPMIDPRTIDLETPPTNPLVPVFAHFAAHAQLYRSVLGPDGSARVINHLFARMQSGAYSNLNLADLGRPTHATDPDETPRHAESGLISGALLGMAIDWLGRGCPGSPEQLAEETWPLLVAVGSVHFLGAIRPPVA
jgi:AcrR family transcriptional regulator